MGISLIDGDCNAPTTTIRSDSAKNATEIQDFALDSNWVDQHLATVYLRCDRDVCGNW